MVHALRPNPWNNIQEGWRILDWFSAHPEGMNLFTYLLGDEGIPQNWRTMDGFGVNTFVYAFYTLTSINPRILCN